MSRQGFLGDSVGHWVPHLMFYVPQTDGAAWGADPEPMTVFIVAVRQWSDGTAAVPTVCAMTSGQIVDERGLTVAKPITTSRMNPLTRKPIFSMASFEKVVSVPCGSAKATGTGKFFAIYGCRQFRDGARIREVF